MLQKITSFYKLLVVTLFVILYSLENVKIRKIILLMDAESTIQFQGKQRTTKKKIAIRCPKLDSQNEYTLSNSQLDNRTRLILMFSKVSAVYILDRQDYTTKTMMKQVKIWQNTKTIILSIHFEDPSVTQEQRMKTTLFLTPINHPNSFAPYSSCNIIHLQQQCYS